MTTIIEGLTYFLVVSKFLKIVQGLFFVVEHFLNISRGLGNCRNCPGGKISGGKMSGGKLSG